MVIKTAIDAKQFIRAWSGKVRPGILKETIRGLGGAESIMSMSRSRYSEEEITNMKAAITVLKDHQTE